jgi:hypothetical protein
LETLANIRTGLGPYPHLTESLRDVEALSSTSNEFRSHSGDAEEQRQEFGRLVGGTIRRIESADFLPQQGIRFP